MTPFDFVEIAVLDPNGVILGPNQIGRLVANSPCTMKCYKNNVAATDAFFVKDSNGKTAFSVISIKKEKSICGTVF